MSIAQMSLAGGALVLFTAILRLTLQRRLPRGTFLALWGVALARFLIPFSIPSPVSVYTAISRAPMLSATVGRLADSTVARTALTRPIIAAPASAAAPFPWSAAVWIMGMVLCAGFFVCAHLRSRKVYAQSLPCRDLPVLVDVNHNGPWRKIAVRVSDQIITPLTYGLFHPVILLPKMMDEENRDFVLSHELCHIRRMDVLWKGLFALCACVHWFNPASWLMLMLAGRDLELSCDEKVVRNLGGKTRKAYALTLIYMEEQKALANPIASGFSKSALEQRIKEVLSMKRKPIWIVLISAVLVAVCAIVFATSAFHNERPAEQEASQAPYIADMLLNQDERLNSLNLSHEELLRAVLQDAFVSGEYDYMEYTFDGSVPADEFTERDAEDRAALLAEKLNVITLEVADRVGWPNAIREKLMAEGLSDIYIREHFLVNQCYFYIDEYDRRSAEKSEPSGSIIETERNEVRMAFNMPAPDEAIRKFMGEAASGVKLVYSTRDDPSVKNKSAYDYANYWDDGKENRAYFNWAECRVELTREGATPLQYNDDPEWGDIVSPSPSEGAYTRDEALNMALEALDTHLGIDPGILTLQSVSVDSPAKKNAGMYLFWFGFQIDGVLLLSGEFDGIVPFARVWVSDEGVRRIEATPLVVTEKTPVPVMTPGEIIDKHRLKADPSDAQMGYACIRGNGILTAVPIWTNLADKRYDVVSGEQISDSW